MSIQEISLNFKRFLQNGDTVVAVVLIFVGITSFLLGRASVQPSTTSVKEGAIEAASINALEVKTTVRSEVSGGPEEVLRSDGAYVASKTGTKYHLPWCSGAQRIKEENKVWFASKEEAEMSGYTPAANCKGI